MLNFIKNISPMEMVLIVLILVILFGAKVITKLARTGGESLKEIKNIKKTFSDALEEKDSENK